MKIRLSLGKLKNFKLFFREYRLIFFLVQHHRFVMLYPLKAMKEFFVIRWKVWWNLNFFEESEMKKVFLLESFSHNFSTAEGSNVSRMEMK